MPISSRTSYDNHGLPYDVTKIINSDSSLNLAKYEQYSPLFLPTAFAISYGLSFASITGEFSVLLMARKTHILNDRHILQRPSRTLCSSSESSYTFKLVDLCLSSLIFMRD